MKKDLKAPSEVRRENKTLHMNALDGKQKLHSFALKDFADSFGTSVEDIPDDCRELLKKMSFKYKKFDVFERDKFILDILKKIDADKQIIGSPERFNVWHCGWADNLKEFIETGYDLKKLTPKFIRSNQAIRLNQDYVLPVNPNFELDFLSVFRTWLFKKYLKDYDAVYEFGCGSGFNLAAIAQLYPDKRFYGLDFVKSSVDLINKIGDAYAWNMKGYLFDMITPDKGFCLERNSAVFTFGAIEQLAGKFEAFLTFLLSQSPAICMHIEPTIELYDENNLVDYLAIKFHRKRGYTENYLTRLRELEAQNKIEILKVKRLFFGSLYMEGYSLIIWKPRTREE